MFVFKTTTIIFVVNPSDLYIDHLDLSPQYLLDLFIIISTDYLHFGVFRSINTLNIYDIIRKTKLLLFFKGTQSRIYYLSESLSRN